MNAMKRAHEIRKEAAAKWNCKTSEIIFSICLKMAWAETKAVKMEQGEEFHAWIQKMNGEDVYSSTITVIEEKETAVKLAGLSNRDKNRSYWISKKNIEATDWGFNIRVNWFK